MHYVKYFNINGVKTKQVACIELHGKPNAATEGAVGVLAIDMDSPSRDMYKCVAVNGAIYTWMPVVSDIQLPIPTENTEKMITEPGYYVAYAVYSGITYPIGLFYYPEGSLGLHIQNGNNYLRIILGGSVEVGTISQSVDESGNVVNTYTELPWYTLYTAKLS